MSDKLENLQQLVGLAQEPTPDARRKLLRDVTDLFMQAPDSLTEQEIDSFGYILVQLTREMEIKLRRHLAETIAGEKSAPRQLIAELAADEIEVASPVLTASPVLEDADLLKIIRKHTQAHLLAISKRPAISDPVAGSLAEKGDDRVLGSLASNPGADLSETTMGTMLSRAVDKQSLGTALIGRADLSPETAKRLFTNVSGVVLEQIFAANPSLDRGKYDALMAESRVWFDGQLSDDDKTAAQDFVARKKESGQLDTELLSAFVADGDVWRFVAGLASLTQVDLDLVRKSMFDPSCQKLAVLCKAVDMKREAFEAVVGFTNFSKPQSARDREALFGLYDGMAPEPAQRALRILRERLGPAA